MNEAMTRCVETCLICYISCLSTTMNHRLEAGEACRATYFRLMMACAEICRTSAHFLADQYAPPQAYVRRMRRNLHRVRQGLQAHRWNG